MKKLYVDMDGTLAVWRTVPIEELTKSGYFRHLPEVSSVVAAIKIIIREEKNVEIFILSSVFQDDHSVMEKIAWLREKLPEIGEERMIFVPYGEPKSNYVKETGTFLLDDFSKNLHEWNGTGIKIYNGINGTKGSWDGYSVHSRMKPQLLAKQLIGIINSK